MRKLLRVIGFATYASRQRGTFAMRNYGLRDCDDFLRVAGCKVVRVTDNLWCVVCYRLLS